MAEKSWIPVGTDSDFPIQNLPFGVFSTGSNADPRVGVAIGEQILDMAAASAIEPLAGTKAARTSCFQQSSLNQFMRLGREEWRRVREAVTGILREDNPKLRDNASLRNEVLIPMKEAKMHLPARIGDYTDFYACQEHARNAAGIKTGLRVLTSNWLKLPVAYHSRSSSVVLSGTDIPRPRGQAATTAQGGGILSALRSWWTAAYPETEERPCKAMDYELEMAFLIGPGNPRGKRIPVDEAEQHIFGMVLMNDWSARDFQKFEMFPLGPFNSKNFATAISPWVVTLDALREFRKPAKEHDTPVLPYLQEKERTSYDINLTASIQPEGSQATIVSRTNYQQLYWSPQQMIAHHTFGGCDLRPGDLLGTGTISSPGKGGQGCLLELSWGGTRSIELHDGETRTYLKDGDTVTLAGHCQGDGYRIGFGECRGKILPCPE